MCCIGNILDCSYNKGILSLPKHDETEGLSIKLYRPILIQFRWTFKIVQCVIITAVTQENNGTARSRRDHNHDRPKDEI